MFFSNAWILQNVAEGCRVLQSVAVCCRALQVVAVCSGSVLFRRVDLYT